jgi:hypothetical protein
LWQAAGVLLLTRALERPEDIHHPPWIVSAGQHVPQAKLIRLRFIVPAESQKHQAQARFGKVSELRDLGGEDHAGG